MSVITRFPPSPTGHLHIGSARTALFNALFAARSGGKMVLRFEDTDKERSKPEFEKDIVEGLAWLQIPYTLAENPRQSERGEVYKKYIPQLIESGAAYEAEESKDGTGKVIRFKNPNKELTFADAVRGEVTFDTTDLNDFVIAKNINEPLYHLAVIIDDHEMGVTHVIRGEDHISNTPRQILILEALGFTRPEYAHIPLILAPDKSKLSKRHGAVSVTEYRDQGFIPEALINYLALLGWNPGGEREIFSFDELAKEFSLDRVHKGGAVFDIEKLKWFNHEHLKRLSDEEFSKRVDCDPKFAPVLKERARTLIEAKELLKEFEFNSPMQELLLKGSKTDAATAKQNLQKVLGLIKDLEPFTKESVEQAVLPYASEAGKAQTLWPMRVALSGKEKSPDPFTFAALVGKETTLKRIEEALQKL